MTPENALISRRMFPVGDGTVIVHEVWNTKHPDCPFVSLGGGLGDPGHIQTRMTEDEFATKNPPMK